MCFVYSVVDFDSSFILPHSAFQILNFEFRIANFKCIPHSAFAIPHCGNSAFVWPLPLSKAEGWRACPERSRRDEGWVGPAIRFTPNPKPLTLNPGHQSLIT